MAPLEPEATATAGADEVLELAGRVFAAIETGDLDTVRTLYADDFEAWTNFDDRTQPIDGTVKVLAWLHAKMPDLRYDIIRREVIPGGFLQQHVLRGTAPDGSAIAMPACVVATVADGRISRMAEYLDPAALAALSR